MTEQTQIVPNEPSEAQLKYANGLGIENPSQYDRQTLKGMISAKVNGGNNKKAPAQSPQKAQTSDPTSSLVMNDTLRPHSYEHGKAGARHKIYYDKVEDLIAHIEALKEVGLYEEFETIKIGDNNGNE